jgi:KUP system potassium uptake protein
VNDTPAGAPADPPTDAGPPPEDARRMTTGLTGARPIPPEVLHAHADRNPKGRRLALLSLTALGVVYGDIGTSPLYALRECFAPSHGLTPTPRHVLGVLSLLTWALILVVTVKYVGFILRADNKGEGGMFALLALLKRTEVSEDDAARQQRRTALVLLGLVGASLLYGEGIITPAISVLGAVEGLETAVPAFEAVVVPVTLAIIVGLFLVQHRGTATVGRVFGPVMAVWFGTIAILGIAEIAQAPAVVQALNPWHGLALIAEDPLRSFVLLGSVVLAVTGAEALYADLGHFGPRPIRLAWLFLVLPALLLNYYGQGALLLRVPDAINENPFFLLAPRWFLYPLIALATLAAIVASQALISGAFSLTQQAILLGYSPRMTIIHTSEKEAGQIYVKEVNTALMVGTVLMVLFFRSSSAIGAAYGIAVTGAMTITSLLFFRVLVDRWKWPRWRAIALVMLFLAVDVSFFSANVIKVGQGGWVPLVIAAGLFTLMTTWKTGRAALTDTLRRGSPPVELFLDDIRKHKGEIPRVDGTAVFMTSEPSGIPVVLLHHLKHNKVLHKQVVILSIRTEQVPQVPAGEGKIVAEPLGEGFWRVVARYGFMESPDVKYILGACALQGLMTKPSQVTYYLGRERILATGQAKMWRWRKQLYAFMSRNARSAAEFFGIPPNRVVELGAQIEL